VTATRRVLVLGASVGGCDRAAEAVADAVTDASGGRLAVEILDFFKRFAPRVANLAVLAHRTGAPFMPDARVDLSELTRSDPDDPLVRELATAAVPALRAAIEALRPVAVVATHPIAAAAAAELRLERDFAAVSVVCDLAPLRLWVHPGLDLVCVAGEDVRERLALQGAEWDKVAITGVPVRSAFFGAAGERTVHTARPRATIVAPGENTEVRKRIVRELTASGISARDASGGDPAPAVAASDLAVCAGGGELLWSASAAGVPLLLLGEPPAAERPSADLLVAAGGALVARDIEHLAWVAGYLARRAERLSALRDAARAFGRPAAARAIAERVLALVG
jgi:processive 1,2-diacylglycerol beta-glucosyltransferase